MAKAKLKNFHIGGEQLPLIVPPSSWQVPTELPDLRRCGMIAVDTEGRDDGISNGRGSGWPYGSGFISGIAVAWDGGRLYLPVRHPDTENLDKANVSRWLTDHFSTPDLRVVMHHASHDVGWLKAEWGLESPVHLDDTEGMAAIIDENRLKYNLDDLCAWRGIVGKDETLLNEAAAAFGVDPKSGMHRLPARFVGPYAEQDAAATLALAKSLDPVLDQEGTRPAYELEMDLVPMVREMRARGIRVDLDAAEKARATLLDLRNAVFKDLISRLDERVGMEEIGRTSWLEKVFTKQKISFPRTAPTRNFPNGQPSFRSGSLGWMDSHPHWLPQLIVKADRYNNAAEKFVKNFILDYAHKGRLHASINQYRGEEGGARTSRFSYSDPALQQMPARDKEITPLIRGCFLPEEGQAWLKADCSQQEYRLIVHFAALLKLPKAEEAAARYRDDPDTDFHKDIQDWGTLDRDGAKALNFAKAYRAGIPRFAQLLKKSESEAEEYYDRYDNERPYVRQLAEYCQRLAERRGYLTLIDGARLHFDRWEPAWREGGYAAPRSLDAARKAWPEQKLRRAFCYHAINSISQGSAARSVKLWMRACWKDGIVPMLQVHDDLNLSTDSEEDGTRMADLMHEVSSLQVPVKVAVGYGRNWADAKHSWKSLNGGD
jgi:DNA polymerase I-like protein with 3'-5' exonuclease and polymerase domains